MDHRSSYRTRGKAKQSPKIAIWQNYFRNSKMHTGKEWETLKEFELAFRNIIDKQNEFLSDNAGEELRQKKTERT